MEEFEINVNGLTYKVIPKSFKDGTYSIIYEGEVYKSVRMDENEEWIEVQTETDLPVNKGDVDHINELGWAIENHIEYNIE